MTCVAHAAGVACLAPVAHAQSPTQAVAQAAGDSLIPVAGAVRGPTGLGIANAEVTLTPRPGGGVLVMARRVYTNDSGGFSFPAVPRGAASIAVRRIGFKPVALDATVPSPIPLTFSLEPTPQRLSTVVVQDRLKKYEGPLADFNRRHDFGIGSFVTRSQIDARNPMRTSDLLRTMPGVAVQSGMGQSTLRLRGSRCDPLVWIDGTPALSGYLDVDTFTPNSLDGIEVYKGVSEVPVELRGPRGEERCGVIALWTRMPERRPKQSKRKPVTAEELNALIASATVYTADQVDRPAKMDDNFPLEPTYPDSLKQARAQGTALLEFVVDTEGRVETETINVVLASHPAFGRAAREAAFSTRFVPAMMRGTLVRQLVQLPVEFHIGNGLVKKD